MAPRPEPGTRRDWQWPSVSVAALPGGLRLLSCHIPGRPVTSLDVMPGLSPQDDPRSAEGLAALTAEALTQGAGDLDASAFAAAVEAQGATMQGSAGILSTRLQLDVPASRLSATLPLLGTALAAPLVSEADVSRLVAQRLDTIAREQALPEVVTQQHRDALLLAATDRLSRPVGGTPDSVRRIDAPAVRAQWAGATREGATVVVVGDLTGLEVAERMTAALDQWRPTGAVALAHPRAWGAPGKVVIVDRPGSVQTQLSLGVRGPGRADPVWAASQIATFALGGTVTSRLDRVLREDKGYTYGIRASGQSWGSVGLLGISGSVETSVTGPALADLREVLSGARQKGFTEDEVGAAVDYLVGVAPTRLQSSRAIVSELRMCVAEGLPISWPADHLTRLRALSCDEVNVAVQAWDPQALTWVLCGDAGLIAGPVESLGLGPVEVVSA